MNKFFSYCKRAALLMLAGCAAPLFCDNQTADLSPVVTEPKLPFTVKIKLADFHIHDGIHSFASASWDGKWLFIAGRTNGLHNFNNDINNFPPSSQNRTVYVVDPKRKKVYSRSLDDLYSGLSQEQVDYLSVTSPQFYQSKRTLYITGGYGVDSSNGLFSTKDVLTAIDIPGMMHWVMKTKEYDQAVNYVRQIHNPVFQVTGGYMNKVKKKPTLLIFGQNFQGYYFDNSNGAYTEQVLRFHILDNGKKLGVKVLPSRPSAQDPDYRRRDLNIVPVMQSSKKKLKEGFVAYGGVFTVTDGVWTIPVSITSNGSPSMDSADDPQAFKQAMNQYVCATVGLYSKKTKDMYTVFLGGISYGFFQNGQFQTDSEIPFINQVTTIKRDKHGNDTQYLMQNEYPDILSMWSNPGNTLLFGAGAEFMNAEGIPQFRNEVLQLDKLKEETVIGYIVGGIMSTLPNTNTGSDSAASPYVFKVILVPTK